MTSPATTVGTFTETGTPIMKLYDELLWKIFLLNADMKGNEPLECESSVRQASGTRSLTIARRTSQVCKQWREITLGSPSLWGRLIDLSLFAQVTNPKWMEEVLRRSGQSFLHVRGRIPSNMAPAFIHLIDINWERIRLLDVLADTFSSVHIEEVSKMLGRPAKHLQSYSLFFHGKGPTGDSHDRPILFCNDAPHLTDFHWSNLGFDFRFSWLSQLHTLEIGRTFTVYDISQLLALFAQMPFLEDLTLEWAISLPEDFDLPQTTIDLSRLRNLGLTDEMWGCAAFLESIRLSPTCSLSLKFGHNEWQGEDLTNVYSTLRQYSEDHFKTQNPEALFLDVSSRVIEFFDCTPLSAPVFPGFSFHAICEDMMVPLSDIETSHIISSFASSRFESVKFFYFSISSTNLFASDPSFMRFLSGLQSVRVLGIEEEVLQFLLGTRDTMPPVLPRLKVLLFNHMPDIFSNANFNNASSEPLLSFLKWRKEAGVPVQVLNVMLCTGYSRDFGFLEEITGLRVRWHGGWEYLCGSGQPELLKLSRGGWRDPEGGSVSATDGQGL